MSTASGRPSRRQTPPRLPEYESDPRSPRRRRRRAAALVAVVVFCLIYGLAFGLFAPYLMTMFLAPLGLLALIIIWALPSSRTAPTGLLALSVFGLLCTLLLWPNYLAVAIPGLPWITLNRIAEFTIATSLLISISQSAAFRRELGQALNAAPLVYRLLLGFVVLQFLTIPLSHYVSDSISAVLITQVMTTTVYFASAWVFLKPGRAERWAAMVWGFLIVVGVMAIPEYRHGHVLWAGHIPSFLKIEDPIVQAIMRGGGRAYTGVYRTQGTFSTALGFGEFIAISSPFVLYFLIEDFKPAVRLAAALSIPFVVYVALLTGSRSAMLGCLISAMMWLLTWGVLRWRREPNSLLGFATVMAYPAAGAAVLAATFFVGRLHRAVWGGGETVSSTQARIDQWHMGLPMILKNPFGYGAGQSGITLGYRMENGELSIDSYFLVILLDYGVLGFIVFFGMFAAAAYYAATASIRRVSEVRELRMLLPLTMSILNFILVKSVFAQADNHILMFMVLGMISALLYRLQTSEPAAAAAPPPAKRSPPRAPERRRAAAAPPRVDRPQPIPRPPPTRR